MLGPRARVVLLAAVLLLALDAGRSLWASVARLEMGLHAPPLSRLRKLAGALGVKVAALVE